MAAGSYFRIGNAIHRHVVLDSGDRHTVVVAVATSARGAQQITKLLNEGYAATGKPK
jgi:hypothetical protein